jgi:hypothetical protein
MARSPIALVVSALALSLGLSACSGMSAGNGSLPGSAEMTQTIGDTADALVARRTGSQNAGTGISTANALGGRIRQLQLASGDDAWSGFSPALRVRGRRAHCEDGIELFAPDRNGDPNSTEALFFYDAGCTSVALDDVRLYTSTGRSSETVHRTDSLYAPGSSTATAVETSTSNISNATFGRYGLPNPAAGFADVTAGQVSIGTSPVLSANAEFVMMPGTRASGAFCGDSAGFDPTGIASLDSTFGYQGAVLSGGSRTSSGNAFVTWSATSSGTAFQGPIGSLSVATGSQNLSCPIATPNFTLNGGTAIGTYSIPMRITFHRGELWSLTITGATLPGGDTLNVRTNHARRQGSRGYIVGSISNGGTSIATFGVSAFGNGVLTVTSTGAQYKIVDWIVVQ